MFDAGKTRMIGLLYGKNNYDDMLSRFHLIPERHVWTDGRTDGVGRTDRIAIPMSPVSVLTRDKNELPDTVVVATVDVVDRDVDAAHEYDTIILIICQLIIIRRRIIIIR